MCVKQVPRLVAQLAAIIPYVELMTFTGAAVHGEFKHLLLSIVESFSQHTESLLALSDSVISSLLPAVLALLPSDNGDTRFVCFSSLGNSLECFASCKLVM
jgi:hypothetical protein